jgi:hypothetical protein
VVLAAYPVDLGMRQAEHVAEMLREFELIVVSEVNPGTDQRIPRRLLDLVHMITSNYTEELNGPSQALDAAARAGQPSVDLHYPLVPETREVVGAYAAIMEEVDEFCRRGSLLTLATPPDLLPLRQWTVSEFLQQADGLPPTPWPAFSSA